MFLSTKNLTSRIEPKVPNFCSIRASVANSETPPTCRVSTRAFLSYRGRGPVSGLISNFQNEEVLIFVLQKIALFLFDHTKSSFSHRWMGNFPFDRWHLRKFPHRYGQIQYPCPASMCTFSDYFQLWRQNQFKSNPAWWTVVFSSHKRLNSAFERFSVNYCKKSSSIIISKREPRHHYAWYQKHAIL